MLAPRRPLSRFSRLLRPCGLAVALVLHLAVVIHPVFGQDRTAPGAFYRIFLLDGTTLTSYGDFARVGERVVFSLPIGAHQGEPRLHLASVPVERVDWPTTERYREATKAAQYAATRGDQDFADLSAQIAALLNDIGLAEDPKRRLALAEDARASLSAWPAQHYGYRSDEIRQILALVDEVISDLRVAAGESRFDLELVAGVVAPPPLTPLPDPTLQESIVQALWAAEFAEGAAERRALLEAAMGTLDIHVAELPRSWAVATRARTQASLAYETSVDIRLARIRSNALSSLERLSSRADVRGVERLIKTVREEAAVLPASRTSEVHPIIELLEGRLEATRRLRLAWDQWEAKAGALRAYQRGMQKQIDELGRGRTALDDIRALAGPRSDALKTLERRLSRAGAAMAALPIPPDAQSLHALVTSAMQMATTAAQLRRSAVESGNIQQARDASAAAAGALMLLERARQDVAHIADPPTLP
ncbi:MAG: hypothetical protein AB7I50_11935 [Vicinamibacterales bacterium]